MTKRKTAKRTLYTYVAPINRQWVLNQTRKRKTKGGYSGFINQLITRARVHSKAA